MFLGFNKLYLACIKYNFSFVLNAEGYRQNSIEILLRPNDNKVYSLTITAKGYRELFKNAVSTMKKYRASRI